MILFTIEIIEVILLVHTNGILSFETLRPGRRARHCQVTVYWNAGLVEAHHHYMHYPFSAQHNYATDFFSKIYDYI